MNGLTPADDDLHPPTTDDPYWTETAWFAFAVPERRMTGFIYPVFRPNLGVCASAVHIWDQSGETEIDCLYSHNYWHVPMPDSLRSMALPSGLSYEVIEPLRSYRVAYESDEVQLDLRYDGLCEPIPTPRGDHLDQPCRVHGNVTLAGETFEVDGFELRDRSWSERSDHSLRLDPSHAEGSYSYAVSSDTAFLARTMGGDPRSDRLRRGGWLWRNGVASPLVAGKRTVEREDGRPSTVQSVEGRDELGRTFDAHGMSINHFVYRSTPAMAPWISGCTWTIDGAEAWGETQEWTLGDRARRAGSRPYVAIGGRDVP
jgi:hypothetical protein